MPVYWYVCIYRLELELCCLMPLATIFQLYQGSQFYLWRKTEYPEKTTDLSQMENGEDYPVEAPAIFPFFFLVVESL